MRYFLILSILILNSCTLSKYPHSYFANCEEKFDDFTNLSSCGLKEIQEDCEDNFNCKNENSRFVDIIKRLKIMVDNKEISENEAMFRYLNLIELEESKFQNKNNKNFNYGYYPSYNDFYVRGMLPFYFRNGYFY
mgnify:CR=1 FL=1